MIPSAPLDGQRYPMSDTQQLSSLPLEVRVHDCRAIKDATIVVDGLTVLCGPNACGKSTLARILRDGVTLSLEYRDWLRGGVMRQARNTLLLPLVDCLLQSDSQPAALSSLSEEGLFVERLSAQQANDLLERIGKIVTLFLTSFPLFKTENGRRALEALKRRLNCSCSSQTEFKGWLAQRLADVSADLGAVEATPLSRQKARECGWHSGYLWEGDAQIREGGSLIFSYQGAQVVQEGDFFSVKRVLCLESPYKDEPSFANGRLSIGSNTLPVADIHSPINPIPDFFSALGGDVVLAKNPVGQDEWQYQRLDGLRIPLSLCATGMRALSSLALLYAYGCLNEDTVLIIDEPEAHLHPAWIVEYARILVLVAKRLRVRLLLASHSPDMMEALRAFALSANLAANTHFYLATAADTPYQFVYTDHGVKIGAVFDSFNTSFSGIETLSKQAF